MFDRLVHCDVCFQSNTRGTVKDKANFKVDEDVSALRKAIEGLGKLTDINEPLFWNPDTLMQHKGGETVQKKKQFMFLSYFSTTQINSLQLHNDPRDLFLLTFNNFDDNKHSVRKINTHNMSVPHFVCHHAPTTTLLFTVWASEFIYLRIISSFSSQFVRNLHHKWSLFPSGIRHDEKKDAFYQIQLLVNFRLQTNNLPSPLYLHLQH